MPNSPSSSAGSWPSRSGSSDSSAPVLVTLEVPPDHPLLLLERELPWSELEQVLGFHWKQAGKNVDGGRGRAFDVRFHTRAVVLKMLRRLNTRELERELKENAPARLFVQGPLEAGSSPVRDHSNLERALQALGVEGVEQLNALVLEQAVELEFADPQELSSDTTVQELPIGYPNEPGILRQVAQRLQRVVLRLNKAGVALGEAVLEPGRKMLALVRQHRLEAKSAADKRTVLERIVEQSQELVRVAGQVQLAVASRTQSFFTKASAKLGALADFVLRLVPQIQFWMHTGQVAKDKLLHPGLQQARAIVRNKLGKTCEFGFQWLLSRLGGGYVVGQMMPKPSGESRMPLVAMELYQRFFGEGLVPSFKIYDRGGWAKKTVQALGHMGVSKIGIVPKGRASWLVGEADRDTVKTLRAQTEALIGTLKSDCYGFNKPKQRSSRTVELAGQGCLVSFNLNKLLRDLQT